jgi:hypothetical protein
MAPWRRAGQSQAPLSCVAPGRHASWGASARTLGVNNTQLPSQLCQTRNVAYSRSPSRFATQRMANASVQLGYVGDGASPYRGSTGWPLAEWSCCARVHPFARLGSIGVRRRTSLPTLSTRSCAALLATRLPAQVFYAPRSPFPRSPHLTANA